MRGTGIVLIIVGIIWALIAFNMNVTVTTESRFYSGAYSSHYEPPVTVNNIGLMEDRRNHLMFAGLTILAGVVLIGFGSLPERNSRAESEVNSLLKPCPSCAEKIQPAARKCRFCNTELPEDFKTTVVPQADNMSNNETLNAMLAHIEENSAPIDTYMTAAALLGGRVSSKSFFLDKNFTVEFNGSRFHVSTLADLRRWFLDNLRDRMSG